MYYNIYNYKYPYFSNNLTIIQFIYLIYYLDSFVDHPLPPVSYTILYRKIIHYLLTIKCVQINNYLPLL